MFYFKAGLVCTTTNMSILLSELLFYTGVCLHLQVNLTYPHRTMCHCLQYHTVDKSIISHHLLDILLKEVSIYILFPEQFFI